MGCEVVAIESALTGSSSLDLLLLWRFRASRTSQTYLDQTVADIVQRLASSIDIAQVERPHLPLNAVDDRRSVWPISTSLPSSPIRGRR